MHKIDCSDYSIFINDYDALSQKLNDNKYSKRIIIVDENTKRECLSEIKALSTLPLEVIEIESGEKNKTLDTCQKIWDRMIEIGADRHSLCINLGGGVIGDMGGFAAATFMRGMDFIQVPTTLLSQVDASVGGKLGIDYHRYKNLIGSIISPNGVYIFTDFLTTLPYRQLLSGFAEIIKHALIHDKEAFDQYVKFVNLEAIQWEDVIFESVKIKQVIVEQDPYERGVRKLLNFGHTIGHAIESYHLEGDHLLLHGEAVAIGMICETFISSKAMGLSMEKVDRVKKEIIDLYGHRPELIPDTKNVVELMKQDKKNFNGKTRFTLLEDIGEAQFDVEVSDALIGESLAFYKEN